MTPVLFFTILQHQRRTIGHAGPARALTILSLLLVCFWGFLARDCKAQESPVGCSLINGNTSQSSFNFLDVYAYVGDTVPVFPGLGMTEGACAAVSATYGTPQPSPSPIPFDTSEPMGIIYLANYQTHPERKIIFMGNTDRYGYPVILNPGTYYHCPASSACSDAITQGKISCSSTGVDDDCIARTSSCTDCLDGTKGNCNGRDYASCCPSYNKCLPGPYNVHIEADMVGAAVSSPAGDILGVANKVRAIKNGKGTVLTGQLENFGTFKTASIEILHRSGRAPVLSGDFMPIAAARPTPAASSTPVP